MTLDLREVDSAVVELGDPVLIAAMAMRKLQALHLLSTPGVRTTTDVVVAIVQDLQRALIQAPNMRLRLAASAADWDAELAALDGEPADDEEVPVAADEADAEADRFRLLHGRARGGHGRRLERLGGGDPLPGVARRPLSGLATSDARPSRNRGFDRRRNPNARP